MNRLIPALALLILLASASEARACWPWCSRVFASISAPLPEFEIVLPNADEEEPLQVAALPKRRTVKYAPQIDVEQKFLISPEGARDLFDTAYNQLDFVMPRKRAYRRWLWTIEAPELGFSDARYMQNWGANYVRLDRDGREGALEFNINLDRGALWHEGRDMGLVNMPDTATGMVARGILALGGRRRFEEISYEFNIRRQQDLTFYRGMMGEHGFTGVPNRALVLYAADHSPAGAVLRTLMDFTAYKFEVIADANGRTSRGSNFKVWFGYVWDPDGDQPTRSEKYAADSAKRTALRKRRTEPKDKDE